MPVRPFSELRSGMSEDRQSNVQVYKRQLNEALDPEFTVWFLSDDYGVITTAVIANSAEDAAIITGQTGAWQAIPSEPYGDVA